MCVTAQTTALNGLTLTSSPGRRPPFPTTTQPTKTTMSLGTILLIVLILMLIGAFPSWRHSGSWGYGPSGGIGLVLIIVIVLLLTGRL